jgi:hypothetical protein
VMDSARGALEGGRRDETDQVGWESSRSISIVVSSWLDEDDEGVCSEDRETLAVVNGRAEEHPHLE